MRSDVDLERTPVFRNLDYQWSWYGLTLADIPWVLIPGAVLINFGVVFDISMAWSLVAMSGSAVSLLILKWRKPEGYVQGLIHMAFSPRCLSHKARDAQLQQFPLKRQKKN